MYLVILRDQSHLLQGKEERGGREREGGRGREGEGGREREGETVINHNSAVTISCYKVVTRHRFELFAR